jgi:putative sterol carrier protein
VVAEFLSAGWVAALDAAARRSTLLTACAGDGPFVLEQRVELPTGDQAVHRLVFAADGARVLPGATARPDVVLTTDLDTAVALAQGDVNAQQALAAGRLHVQGDLDVLTSRSDALAAVDDIFATVRAETTFPSTGSSGPRR